MNHLIEITVNLDNKKVIYKEFTVFSDGAADFLLKNIHYDIKISKLIKDK